VGIVHVYHTKESDQQAIKGMVISPPVSYEPISIKKSFDTSSLSYIYFESNH